MTRRRSPQSTGPMSRTAGSASRKPRRTRAEMARRIAGDVPGFIRGWPPRRTASARLSLRARRSGPGAAYRWTVETGIYLDPDGNGPRPRPGLAGRADRALERQGYVAAIGAIALPNEASVALHEKLGFLHTGTYRRSASRWASGSTSACGRRNWRRACRSPPSRCRSPQSARFIVAGAVGPYAPDNRPDR